MGLSRPHAPTVKVKATFLAVTEPPALKPEEDRPQAVAPFVAYFPSDYKPCGGEGQPLKFGLHASKRPLHKRKRELVASRVSAGDSKKFCNGDEIGESARGKRGKSCRIEGKVDKGQRLPRKQPPSPSFLCLPSCSQLLPQTALKGSSNKPAHLLPLRAKQAAVTLNPLSRNPLFFIRA